MDLALAALAVMLAACGSVEVEATPSVTPVPPTRPRETPTMESTALPLYEEGAAIDLTDPLISYVVQVSLGKQFVYAVVGRQTAEGEKGWLILENADCVRDALSAFGELGEPETGIIGVNVWRPKAKIDRLKGIVLVPGVPPIVTVRGVEEDDLTLGCRKRSVFDDLPQEPAREMARQVGEIVRQVVEGFEAGYWGEGQK